jgi:glycosyltransferase involved in cell wall biosynthesis
MSQPTVSILVPTYNRQDLIIETVQSALSQTYQDFEIVIVDNQSTDNTYRVCLDLAKTDPRIRVYQNEENIGPVRNWQRCVDLANGEYAKILFSDDLMYPEFLEKTLPFLENNSDVGFVFTTAKIGENDKQSKQSFGYRHGLIKSSQYIKDVLLNLYPLPVSPCSSLFRAQDLKQSILTDIQSSSIRDFSSHGAGPDLLSMLITAQNYTYIAHINDCLAFFRRSSDNLTASLQQKSDANSYLTQCYDEAKYWFAKKNKLYLITAFLFLKNTWKRLNLP